MKVHDPNGWKELVEDKDKIQEAILYLLTLQSPLTQFQIVKALWFADLHHLNKYGRPVTFDNYVAMTHGPVPSLAYNALKPSFNFENVFGAPRPWEIKRESAVWSPGNRYRRLRGPRLEYLSETDKEELSSALKLVRKLTPGELKKMVHDHPAWREAWRKRRAASAANPMKLSQMIEHDGEELAKELAYLSEHA